MNKRKQEIEERLWSISPWPWQESYFVDHPKYRNMPEEVKEEHRKREAKTIRAAGKVGTPGCNPVAIMEFAFPYDKDFVLNAPADLDFLLEETDKLEYDLIEAMVLNIQQQIYANQLEQENQKLRRQLVNARIIAKKMERTVHRSRKTRRSLV